MIYAYDEMYVEGAKIRLGDMLEYASLDCGYDPDAFFKMFIKSGIARRFEIGDVSIVAGKSGPELAYEVLNNVDFAVDLPEPKWRSDRSDLYWSGWVLAYFQWERNIPFAEIWDSISIRMLQKMYPTLHEADITKTIELMLSLIEPEDKMSVKTLRLMRGMTQQSLARRANMTVAQLQRIEYGERKVENLTLRTALSLANALGVSVDEIA